MNQHRIVARDGVASAAELQRDYDSVLARRRRDRDPPNPHPTKLRLRMFWRQVMAAREASPVAELETALMQTARDTGLVAEVHKLSRHGEEDVRHVIQWGLRGRDPWGKEFPNGV
jgi:hypothetical protein